MLLLISLNFFYWVVIFCDIRLLCLQAEKDRLKSLNSEMVKDHEIELRTKLEDLNKSLEASWLEKLK